VKRWHRVKYRELLSAVIRSGPFRPAKVGHFIGAYNRGSHLGVFEHGLVRDHLGGVVALVTGATCGPILPVRGIPPIPPLPAIPPIPTIPAIPPIPALPSLGWAAVDWDTFVRA
jgi:hypothetical protein